MDTKKFYEGLRPEDRDRVRLTVDELKARSFDVYVAGSSLERADYNDIDLVAKPQEGMTEGEARAGLDAVLAGLKARGASESVDYTKLLTQLVPDSHRYVQSDVSFRHGLSFGNVMERKGLSLGETKIDISVSYEPFGLNPETENVKL